MAVATSPTRPAAPAALPAGPDGPPPVAEPVDTTLLGVALALVADLMVLGGLVAAFISLRAEAFRWPPKGVHTGTYLPAVILITAAMTMVSSQWPLWAIRRNDQRNCLVGLGLTLVLAVAILNAESYSFGRMGFPVTRHAYGTLRYALVGYHLANVVAGIVLLVVLMARTLGDEYDEHRHDAIRAGALFWQFVAASWMIIFWVLVWVR